MRGAPAIRPKHATLTEMLAEAAQSQASLFFVNRKEQDQEVPMARVRERALSIAADLMARGVRRGRSRRARAADLSGVCGVLVRRAVRGRHPGSAVSARPARQTRRVSLEDGSHAAGGGCGPGCDRRTHPPVPGSRGAARGSSPRLCDRVQPGRHELDRSRARCRRCGIDPILVGHHATIPSRWH